MKCSDKEWDTCRVEKMGCENCFYEDVSDTNVGSIKDIKNFIEYCRNERNFQFQGDYEWHFDLSNELENILKEREQDKARMKELEQYQNMAVEVIKNSILKQEVRCKIEEYKEIIKECINDEEHCGEIPVYEHDIQVLQELLKNKGE